MIKILSFLVFIVLFGSGCTKVKVAKNTPQCIIKKIRKISKKADHPPTIINSYEHLGQRVFYFPARCCDRLSDLYDKNCNLICHPDGGITGGGSGNCNGYKFDESSKILIWESTK